mmetsp:Transcript_7416/g.11908  ORF Transcript_7416/g.11908 Transcript_7416/m.11908 type:complete len:536 (-) Transcript_7416:40-1647(-)|eukprot:CAMPEP_0203760266 /NCGR_PEP_ID=MMETSP0098-20131031/13600_1 /ASSEMBLY_ACC=CAM_ASM_000208 /TAXON_ID=96639 /ORGANISM=" , Strain NY0313808BC1" /LENGTH=535 /DNA_ID=CAMNT_0050653763 /DNA_START=602 /DNA_END=2209 /DNA_ORIENTATION=+
MKSVKELLKRHRRKSRSNLGWQPDYLKSFLCSNGQDNVPATTTTSVNGQDTQYYVSQSRSDRHDKQVGQDCISCARHGDWEINVLCDGHDRDGHHVAQEVCEQLPSIIMRRIHAREEQISTVSSTLIRASFAECVNSVCWTSDKVQTGMFVKVCGGEWDEKVGYVGSSVNKTEQIVVIVDELGYHRPIVPKSSLKRSKYTGGCTCAAFIRNTRTNECRIAITGDSRAMLVGCPAINDPFWLPVYDSDTHVRIGIATPAHNVFNKNEINRLYSQHRGAFAIDNEFLVNPVTKFAIQPTRGFGDFDMYGTGYSHDPEVSNSFILPKDATVFIASDGIFDDHIWFDDELGSFIKKQMLEPHACTADLAKALYKETLRRSHAAGGYVDDISFVLFKNEADIDRVEAKEQEEAPNKKLSLLQRWRKGSKTQLDESPSPKQKQQRNTPRRMQRGTVNRKCKGSFTQMGESSSKSVHFQTDDAQIQKPASPCPNSEQRKHANLVLSRFAKRYGHSIKDIDIGRVVHDAAAQEGKRLCIAHTA